MCLKQNARNLTSSHHSVVYWSTPSIRSLRCFEDVSTGVIKISRDATFMVIKENATTTMGQVPLSLKGKTKTKKEMKKKKIRLMST